MIDTIREQCLKRLHQRYMTMRKGEPCGSGAYTLEFGKCVRAPLTDEDYRKEYACGIVEGQERKTARYPVTECDLEVVIEFQGMRESAEPASRWANRVLGDIQRRLGEDRTLGGIAINCNEMGNEIAFDVDKDKTVKGAVFLTLRYRHTTDDPRLPV